MALALVFKSSELALTEDQADAYARATSGVMKHYDVSATAKTIAWVNLFTTMGGVYWSKFSEISTRKAAEKAKQVKSTMSAQPGHGGGMPRAAMGSAGFQIQPGVL